MKIKIDRSELGSSKWYEYALRFAFGGAVTAAAGIIAKRFGAEVGGLFLAFPAIFPAAATLIEKTETQKKEQAGLSGTVRGRKAAGVDAAGAWMGALGLIVFGLIVWKTLPHLGTASVLSTAAVAWIVTSVLIWELRGQLWRRWKRHRIAISRTTNPVRKQPLENQ